VIVSLAFNRVPLSCRVAECYDGFVEFLLGRECSQVSSRIKRHESSAEGACARVFYRRYDDDADRRGSIPPIGEGCGRGL